MHPAPPRLVVLDFDGTLADSWPWFLGALDETANRYRLTRMAPDQIEMLRGQSTSVILRAFGVRPWQLPRIAIHMRRKALADPPPPLFPGIPALLRRLTARGLRLAIASSNSEAQVARTLGPELLSLVPDRALDAGLFGKPAKLRRILGQTGIPRDAAILIGDEVRDIDAARAAGIAAGAVTWGYAARTALEASRPDILFDRPEAIAAYCDA